MEETSLEEGVSKNVRRMRDANGGWLWSQHFMSMYEIVKKK